MVKAQAWSEELVTDICDHIATGKSMLEIANLKGYPSAATMYRHMARDADFATAIARAREAQQDHEADVCIRMADEATSEDWQVVKLRIWARQWRAAKLAPKRYGDKVALTGADGGAVQFERIERRIVDPKVSEKPGLSRPSELNSPNLVD